MIRCIIIDDERPARDLIELHLSNCKNFKLVASFVNALQAFTFLQTNKTDLIFLDIDMPKVSGIELIKSLKVCPKIILTTAYREYAVEAFELDVLDYIVKPVTQERFLKAISRFSYYAENATSHSKETDTFENAYVFFKSGKDQIKVYLKDILFIEGLRDFVKVHSVNKMFIASERLSYIQEKLPENKFVRIHKSYIAATDKILSYSSDQITIDKISLPIGRNYRSDFLKRITSPGC